MIRAVRILLIALLSSSLGACATPPSETTPMSCNSDAARSAIGQAATADVVERARRDAGASTVRVLKPGQVVTMEYLEGRLNIDVDASNVITNVRCG